MDFFYKKNSKCFKGENLVGVENIQNYIPLYNKFFELNESNYNSINLNNSNFIDSIEERITDNKYSIKIKDREDNITPSKSFIKFSPLLDPIKYIIDKYDSSLNIFDLPKFTNNICHNKMLDNNNLSYVDSFFSFLSSTLLQNYNFINGIDFYGSFLGIKKDFIFNIEDEIDILNDNENFHKNKNNKYTIDKEYYERLFNNSTKKHKHKIILENIEKENDEDILNLSDIKDLDCLDEIFKIDQQILNDISNDDKNKEIDEIVDISDDNKESGEKLENNKDSGEKIESDNKELIYESLIKNSDSSKRHTNSSSSCSSRSSNTEKDSNSDDETDDSDTDDDNESSSESEEENVLIKINKFPVQLIFLENCHDTLDNYIVNSTKIRDDEWDSIVLQILFMLITYQQVFNFTHNDLHTNNIVYNNTDKKYIYYKYKDRHYKVPTFGKIYKIIDFGRSIYSFKGTLMCSDSFSRDGDAHTQYNFEPYFNENKPRLEPNYSFDLCRLGCSLFDFLIDDLDDLKKVKSPIKRIILDWVNDDKDRNILYKNNGEERYPDFKLYKMIARSVHNHVPSRVLENNHFEKYFIAKKRINTPQQIINIDSIPVMK